MPPVSSTANTVAPQGSSEGGDQGPEASTAPAVVVTGGSDGIGLAIARKFLEKGHSVALVARGAGRLAAAVQTLQGVVQSGRSLLPVLIDVTREDAFAELNRELATNGLHFDVLVNNAGIGLGGSFAQQPAEAIDRLVALNVAALTRLTRLALDDMLTRGQGHIINISSLGGYVPGPNQAAYYASKAYVLSLSEALAEELRGSGVRVCVVAPGPVNTSFHESMGADDAFYRVVLPALSPERVALAVYRGYRFNLRVAIPGVLNRLISMSLRVLPHPITVPLTGWLLAQRPRAQR